MMKSLLTLAALLIVSAGPALASGKCTTAPKAQWKPKAALEAQLQADGYMVRQIKVEGGCYEVYASDKDGKRANMAFNAETLEKLDNAEAGEN
ncbi:MAG: PepSY domain-containing protein [Bradyrhizobium sp.]|nr:MAG: PepSY domain-containing protein [Bradyrhizobium sp.]